MRWLLAGLALAVVAVLRSAIEAEAQALLTKLPEWIIRAACRALPKRVRARYRDEMLADLDQEPDRPLWRLATAVRIVLGVARLRWNVRGRTRGRPTPTEPASVSAAPGTGLPREFCSAFLQAAQDCGIRSKRAHTLLAGLSVSEPGVLVYKGRFALDVGLVIAQADLGYKLWVHAGQIKMEPPDASTAS